MTTLKYLYQEIGNKCVTLNGRHLYCENNSTTVCFYHDGGLIGLLMDNGRIRWVDKAKETVKKECRNFVNGILLGTTEIL